MALHLTCIDELTLVTLDRPEMLNGTQSSAASFIVRE
jgi:hypothetical protein